MIVNGSPSQKRWLDLWRNRTPISHICVQIIGDPDIQAIEHRIESVFQSKDILRTVLVDNEYQRFQVLQKNTLAHSSWKGLFNNCSSEALIAQWKEESFDVKTGLLIKIGVVETNQEHTLVICSPSIVLDEESIVKLAKMLLGAIDISEDEIPYSEFSSWWHESLIERKNDGVTFWDDFILNNKPLNNHSWINLPKDPPKVYNLTHPITKNLYQLKSTTGHTYETILLSIWIVLISRWHSDSKFTLGEILNGRTLPELKNVLGPLARMVPYEVTVDSTKDFQELMKTISFLREEALEYQDYFIQNTNDNTEDFFPFQFQFREAKTTSSERIVSLNSNLEPCFLNLSASLNKENISLELKYDVDYFSLDAAKHILKDFTQILSVISENPKSNIKKLQTLTAFDFNESKTYNNEIFAELDIIGAWNKQVKNNADSIALIEEEIQLSYQEVDEKVNTLAQELLENGLGIGGIVMLKISKSIEAIIAILAIQKNGAAYLPLLPDTPSIRAEKFERESGVHSIITYENNQYVIKLGSNPKKPKVFETPLDRCAYIIYTSGSTGQPKGVQVSQRSVLDLVDVLKRTVYEETNKPIAIALLASLSFDASIQQIYAALLCGHTLVLVSDHEKKEPKKIISCLHKNKVNTFDCTPSLLSVLISDPSYTNLRLNNILVGGEPLDGNLMKKLFLENQSQETCVWNLYGLTECGVDSTFMKIDATYAIASNESYMPIGIPLANSQVYILDRFGGITPEGIEGEIYIGGTGVAIGYVNDETLNKERFINSKSGVQKIFKTGDYGRLTSEGVIQFMGRKDAQVKVRGYRIDLLEIKAAFLKIERLKSAEVFIEKSDHNLITAVVCLDNGLTLEKVKEALKNELPEYMIPGQIIELDDIIPINNNGKVDMNLLKEKLAQTYKTSSTDVSLTESKLLSIFTILLKRPLSIEDNIFENGAHSLIVLHAIIKIKEVFHQNIDFDVIYNYSNMYSLARYLDNNNTSENNHRIRALHTHHSTGKNVFLLPSVFGTSSIFSNLKMSPKWNLWGLEYKTENNKNEKTLEELAKAMYKEISAKDVSSNPILIGYSMGAYVAYEVANLLKLAGKSPQLILIDAHINPSYNRYIENDRTTENESTLQDLKQELSILINKYQLRKHIPIPIHVLEAKENKIASNMNQWSSYASSFTHNYIEGSHDDLLSSENIPSLVATLQEILQKMNHEEFEKKVF